MEIWASPEPTFARIDANTYRDQLAETGHDARDGDLDLLASLGIVATRYPVLWERCARTSTDEPDLRWATRRLARLRELGIEPVVTLLHHGSGPPDTSLVDPAFPDRFARYAGAVARAFPWIRRWTPINEPLTTARFATLYGTWYPNARDDASFARAIVNEALAMLLAMAAIRVEAPRAEFTITEDLQSFTALDSSVNDYVEHKRRRMYLSVELVAGRVVPGHELYAYLVANGVSPRALERVARIARPPDLVGWNYYPNSERAIGRDAAGNIFNEPARLYGPISPRPLLRAAFERTGLAFGISEAHVNAGETDRARWLYDRFDDLAALRGEGLPVRMLGAWAAFGLVDWDSLLTRRENYREDGVFTFAGAGDVPRETAVSRAVRVLSARGSVPAGRSERSRTLAGTDNFAPDA